MGTCQYSSTCIKSPIQSTLISKGFQVLSNLNKYLNLKSQPHSSEFGVRVISESPLLTILKVVSNTGLETALKQVSF